jgi:hypothetical protein
MTKSRTLGKMIEKLEVPMQRHVLFQNRLFPQFFTCKIEIRATDNGLHSVSVRPLHRAAHLTQTAYSLCFTAFFAPVGSVYDGKKVKPRDRNSRGTRGHGEENDRWNQEKA